MAKDKKQINLRDLSTEELSRRLHETQQSLFKIRFRAGAAPVKDTMQIRKLRRDVARIFTFLNQRRQGA